MRCELDWRGERIPKHAVVLLDLWGHNHDEELWGDPYTNHRYPGEPAVVAMLRTLAVRLANLDYEVPDQDLTISLRRVPARPASGFVLNPAAAPWS